MKKSLFLSLERQVISDIVITIIGYSFSLLFGLISGILAAHLLGPTGRGELAAIQIIPTTLALLAGLGQAQSISYFTARHPYQAGDILGTALISSLVVSIAFIVSGYLLQRAMLGIYDNIIQFAGLLFLFFIPLNILNSFPWSTIYSAKKFLIWNVLRLQPQFIYTGTLVFAWWLTIIETPWITNTYLFGVAFICVPSSWFVYRKIFRYKLIWKSNTLKMMWPYSFKSFLNYVPNMLNQQIDQVLIAAWLPAQELGFYVVAVSWSGLLNPIMSALVANLFPYLASSSSHLDSDKLFQFTVRWTLVLILLMISVVLLVTPFFILLLFGVAFTGAIRPSLILVLASAFLSINLILSDGFRGIGYPEIPLYAEFIGVVVTMIGLALFLIPYGIMAAAWVSFVSYLFSTIVLGIFFYKTIHFSLEEWVSDYCTEAKFFYDLIIMR